VENFFKEFKCNKNADGSYKWDDIYEMIACNLLFNFIPKVLFYMNSNSSKYELNTTAALNMPCTYDACRMVSCGKNHWC
jgi:hypothetical protein